MAAPQALATSSSWVVSIRTSMENDPAKHWFDTQVQSHGFNFLDDYLENILEQTKSQPIIELVKTPGRKKNTSKKTKFAADIPSKLKHAATPLFDDNDDQTKENIPPANTTFNQALLDTKSVNDNMHHLEPDSRRIKQDGFSQSRTKHNIPSRRETAESSEISSIYPIPQDNEPRSLNLPPVGLNPNDLSVIAESDEFTEQAQHPVLSAARLPHTEARISPKPTQQGLDNDTRPEDNVNPAAVSASPLSSHVFRAIVSDFSEPISEPQTKSVDDHVTSSATMTSANPLIFFDPHSMTAPLPSQPSLAQTFKVPFPLHEIPGTGLMRKASAPQPQAGSNNAATPRDPLQTTLGKRTSWLSKTREVKPSETVLKRISTQTQGAAGTEQLALAVPATTGRTKRKSSEMIDTGVPEESAGRQSKALKLMENDASQDRQFVAEDSRSAIAPGEADQGYMLEHLKRAVEGFGARKGKSMGKSLGGTAAAALAEARATAEARVAEKAKMDSDVEPLLSDDVPKATPSDRGIDVIDPPASTHSHGSGKRLDASELIAACDSLKGQERVFQPPAGGSLIRTSNAERSANVSSNNPPMVVDPISPQKNRQSKPSLSLLSKPVFMKPPPKVFVAPPQPKSSPSKITSTGLGTSPSLKKPAPLSAQSSIASIPSDSVFDRENASPAWMPTTQETEYSMAIDCETQDQETRGINEMEDDDSWHDGDKVGELNHIWTALACAPTEKEDEMTWSTIPTQTHTSSSQSQSNSKQLHDSQVPAIADATGTAFVNDTGDLIQDERKGDTADDMDIDDELVEVDLEPGQMTVNLVKKKTDSGSVVNDQLVAPAESSLENIFQQASRFVTSVLSPSRNGKTFDSSKTNHLAEATAQKLNEGEVKKAAMRTEAEIRRHHAAEDEVVRDIHEGHKKADPNGQKGDHEEHTDKRQIKASVLEVNGGPLAKHKMEVDQKMAHLQETKEIQPARTAVGINPLKSILKSSADLPSQAKASSKPATVTVVETAVTRPTLAKGKGKAIAVNDLDDPQPSRIIQGQMAARAKAQMNPSPPIKSESIQLPEIDSEYSDSEDEDRKKNFDPPEWAQSPNLHNALHSLSTVNPDNIFGAIQPLHIEDMFKSRRSRFRARTSSANWSGTDGLTREEEDEYARRMGFAG